jgi:ABC-type Fe3+/spermidine/putrescine transport system ATPase subunit
MVKDTPRNLFNNPKNSLIASFFGEYNVINGEIVYAHQLKIVSKSNLKAAVRHSYFNGTYYLIEVNFKGKSIFIENVCEINQDDIIHFEIFK